MRNSLYYMRSNGDEVGLSSRNVFDAVKYFAKVHGVEKAQQGHVRELFLFGRQRIKAQEEEEVQDQTKESRIPWTHNIESIHQVIGDKGTNDSGFSDTSDYETNARIVRSDKLFQKIHYKVFYFNSLQ